MDEKAEGKMVGFLKRRLKSFGGRNIKRSIWIGCRHYDLILFIFTAWVYKMAGHSSVFSLIRIFIQNWNSLSDNFFGFNFLNRFFDTTPLGLILNRFSADTNIIDQVDISVYSVLLHLGFVNFHLSTE